MEIRHNNKDLKSSRDISRPREVDGNGRIGKGSLSGIDAKTAPNSSAAKTRKSTPSRQGNRHIVVIADNINSSYGYFDGEDLVDNNRIIILFSNCELIGGDCFWQ